MNMTEQGQVLLPADVRPERYRITLEPDLERFTFHGSESVDVSSSPEILAGCKKIS